MRFENKEREPGPDQGLNRGAQTAARRHRTFFTLTAAAFYLNGLLKVQLSLYYAKPASCNPIM